MLKCILRWASSFIAYFMPPWLWLIRCRDKTPLGHWSRSVQFHYPTALFTGDQICDVQHWCKNYSNICTRTWNRHVTKCILDTCTARCEHSSRATPRSMATLSMAYYHYTSDFMPASDKTLHTCNESIYNFYLGHISLWLMCDIHPKTQSSPLIMWILKQIKIK